MTAQRWEVLTLCGNRYENVWTIDDVPETFASHYEADAALTEHLRDCQFAVEAGDMEDVPTRDEFQIAPYVEARR
jgi:hypothetical protein